MRQRAAQVAKRVAPIPVGIVGYALAALSDAHPLPMWLLPAICVAGALLAVVDKVTDFFLKLLIIKGYKEDYRRKDAGDYVTMLREINQK